MTLDTTSPAFRAWFDGSKIVDENGDPLVVYHGTQTRFSEFDPSLGVEHGIYLTPRRNYAGNYARRGRARAGRGWRHRRGGSSSERSQLALFAAIRHPIMVETKLDITPHDLTADDVAKLEQQGFDGIVMVSPGGPVSTASEIVAFHSHQVKSADNNGDFRLDTANIYH